MDSKKVKYVDMFLHALGKNIEYVYVLLFTNMY